MSKFNQLYNKIVSEWTNDPIADWDTYCREGDQEQFRDLSNNQYCSIKEPFQIKLLKENENTYKVSINLSNSSHSKVVDGVNVTTKQLQQVLPNDVFNNVIDSQEIVFDITEFDLVYEYEVFKINRCKYGANVVSVQDCYLGILKVNNNIIEDEDYIEKISKLFKQPIFIQLSNDYDYEYVLYDYYNK